jgi:5S rRNA maturation endonuclease (ribonuclease M5)
MDRSQRFGTAALGGRRRDEVIVPERPSAGGQPALEQSVHGEQTAGTVSLVTDVTDPDPDLDDGPTEAELDAEAAALGFELPSRASRSDKIEALRQLRAACSPNGSHAPEPSLDDPPLPPLRGDTAEAVYRYEDERGELLFAVARYPGKDFRQLRLVGDRWLWGLGDVRRVLFRLPRVVEHIAANRRQPIYIVEGERDVEAVEAAGGLATCNPMGAGKWTAEHAASLQGARRIVVVADRDEIGRRHATSVVASLAAVGLAAPDVELVEAAVGKDAADHLAADRDLAELQPLELPAEAEQANEAARALRIVPLEEFAAVDEASATPLLGADDEVIIAADSLTVFYGDGGAGKTTLAVDAVAHLASGTSWLGFPVPRPVRVLLIENEGPRGLFRRKLRRKIAAWDGAPFAPNVVVVEEPWARTSFADEELRTALAEELDRLEIDLVVAGPVKRLGMEGGGTPDEVSRFHDLINALRARVRRPLAVLLVHHENKAGGVSGAWSGEPDTLVRVTLDGRDRTIVKLEKTRWASSAHGSKLMLAWAKGEGFTIVDREGLHTAAAKSAEEMQALDWVVAYVADEHAVTSAGVARSKVERAYLEAHEGRGRNLVRRVIQHELDLAAAPSGGEPGGEASYRLARGAGEVKNGIYLYPASHAPSPLAASLTGEGGEVSLEPPPGAAPRQLAAAYREGGERRGIGGEGQEADVSEAEIERLAELAQDLQLSGGSE